MDPLVEELSEITATVNHLKKDELLEYVANCLDPNTPSHEIKLMGLQRLFLLYNSVPRESRSRFEEIIEAVEARMEARGYRSDFYTHQEHTLVGSTVWAEYGTAPHKPIGVIKGDLTVDEAQKARELARMQGAQGSFFGLEGLVTVSLESLDEAGNTVRDPQLLDDQFNPIPTTYSANFPSKRD